MVPHLILILQCIHLVAYMPIHLFLQDHIHSVLLQCHLQMELLMLQLILTALWKWMVRPRGKKNCPSKDRREVWVV
nr:hypothetical protein Iba_scaffold44332CG0010 [Ipomoea batatas]GMD74700.1 hypothetical protein Iba_chr13aCG7800 [Ipomoea batatas]GMD76202.1 hypothetical protein Iba_chr13bCG8070 [Ipomoea batatas]GMD78063.1 hypothetical protein Iba_chr13cCG9360 [Ipomoea batatas]GMD82118.1 hypothetical protein Iba_chr13fCG4980 [Ipomoea batatas]